MALSERKRQLHGTEMRQKRNRGQATARKGKRMTAAITGRVQSHADTILEWWE